MKRLQDRQYPRYKGDKNDDILKYTPLELSDDEMKEILDMIKVK